jgi:hypothetical protein
LGPLLRLFWRWLQLKLRKESLIELKDVLLDATCIEVVLFARVDDYTQERFPDCQFGKKVTQDRWFYGKKLHLLVHPNSTLIRFRLSPGNPHDSRLFSRINKATIKSITMDSAYSGLRGLKGQNLFVTKPFGVGIRQRFYTGKRTAVERVNNALKRLLLEDATVKNSQSLDSHLLSVLACLLAVQYVNLKRGCRPLSYKAFLT